MSIFPESFRWRLSFRPGEKRPRFLLMGFHASMERYRRNASGEVRAFYGLDKNQECARNVPDGKFTILPHFPNRRPTMSNLATGLAAKLTEYWGILEEKLWKQAFNTLIASIADETPDTSGVRHATREAMRTALKVKSRWQEILTALTGHISLLCQLRKEFCRDCNPEALAEFLGGAEGFVSQVLSRLVNADTPLTQAEADEVQFCLLGLTELTEAHKVWVTPLRQMVDLTKQACSLRGGHIEGLQQKFEALLKQFPEAPVAEVVEVQRPAAEPNISQVKPKIQEKPGHRPGQKRVTRRDRNWNGGGQMRDALQGIKVGAA